MNLASILAAASNWMNLLPALLASGANGVAAFNQIKDALKANGIEADTAQLDAVIADAAKRKQHEDDILAGE